MLKHAFIQVLPAVLVLLSRAGVQAQEPDDGQVQEPARPPIVAPDQPDPLWRDQGGSVLPPQESAFPDPMDVEGHRDAVIQGDEAAVPPPEGAPFSASAGVAGDWLQEAGLEVTGFAQAEWLFTLEQGDRYDSTFRPREIEIDVLARISQDVGVRIDFNIVSSRAADLVSSSPLVDELVEEAYLAWSPGRLTLMAGKMAGPLGAEALDVVDRTSLTPSWLNRLATPRTLTGLRGQVALFDELDLYVLVANGWNHSLDNNRSKTAGGGLPHRFGQAEEGGSPLYEGSLAFLVGPERQFVNDLRWSIDYWGRLHAHELVEIGFEFLYGQEEGLGFRDGVMDGQATAWWYAGLVMIDFIGANHPEAAYGDLRAGLQVEFLHDHFLALGIPSEGGADLTTLFGLRATLRYRLGKALELACEYSLAWMRGDVADVAIYRNYGFSALNHWLKSHALTLALVGTF